MARVRAVFSDGLITAISEGIDPDELSVRGGLVSSHMIGLSFARRGVTNRNRFQQRVGDLAADRRSVTLARDTW
jgi:hypothetical protein